MAVVFDPAFRVSPIPWQEVWEKGNLQSPPPEDAQNLPPSLETSPCSRTPAPIHAQCLACKGPVHLFGCTNPLPTQSLRDGDMLKAEVGSSNPRSSGMALQYCSMLVVAGNDWPLQLLPLGL